VGKLAYALLLVVVAVFTPSAAVLLVLLASAVGLCLAARLPASLIAAAAATPLLFAGVFALAAWRGGWADLGVRLARPVLASLAALWLVGTTPYPDLFAPLARVLPRGAGDGLVLTYRAVFALLGRVERVFRALALRGALGGSVRRRAAVVGEALGTVVLSGFERSQRLYQTMLLRGHSGRICGCRHWLEFGPADLWVAGASLWTLAASVALWRVGRP
jgi:cobalt/nickel transport system permease protein